MLVSIIMPCYNASSTILDAINSVLLQTYKFWELIVVDDKSTDNSYDIVSTIKDNRVKLFSLNVNSGCPAIPRNVAMSKAKGEYIAFLDSDDLWEPTKLEKQVKFMAANNYKFTCTAYNIITSEKDYICSFEPPSHITYSMLLRNNSIGCLTVMVHRELIANHIFPVCGHEDYALWLKLIKLSDGVYAFKDKLASHRIVDGSVSSSKYPLFYFFWHIYRFQEGFGIIKSFCYCVRYFLNTSLFKYT